MHDDVRISFADGTAMRKLISACVGGGECDEEEDGGAIRNFQIALDVAHEHGVPALLEGEDFAEVFPQ